MTKVENVNEIFEEEKSLRPATSSFLVYLKEGEETKLTDPICRKISEPQSEMAQLDGSGDVEMLDARSDSPMERLTQWSTDLGRTGDKSMTGGDGLVRDPQFPEHRGVTW